ncbi:MAG: hypothetical protein Rhims3KO_18220 [Hyphomicrobiales bacterium]
MARFDLSDEEWSVIQPLLPKKGRGPVRKDDRLVLNGIFYILRTGAICRSDMGRIRRFITAMPAEDRRHRRANP